MFGRKKEFDETTYADILKRVVTLEIEQTKIYKLMNSLRGMVNRKLYYEDVEEEEESETNKKTLNIEEHGKRHNPFGV